MLLGDVMLRLCMGLVRLMGTSIRCPTLDRLDSIRIVVREPAIHRAHAAVGAHSEKKASSVPPTKPDKS